MRYNVLITESFKRELKRIAKKHRQIINDIHLLVNNLQTDPKLGTNIGNNIYKIRLSISGTSKGKSSGARIITYLKLHKDTIILAELYLKSEFPSIDIKTVLKRLEADELI